MEQLYVKFVKKVQMVLILQVFREVCTIGLLTEMISDVLTNGFLLQEFWTLISSL